MPDTRPGLQPGLTKLVRADNLAAALGARLVWVKDDSGNPTHSFKDRVVAVALENARRLGYRTIACASTGNLANAVAAAAARAGLKSVVFVPSNLEAGKIVTTAVYGGTLVAIDGHYDDVNRLCSEIAANRDWGFVNVNLRPYYAEGSKTVGFEIAEQLGWRLPEAVVSPVASGSLLTKVDKAFAEFVRLGLVEDTPYQVFGAQATGCSPVSQAFRGRPRHHPPGEARHDREVAGHRQSGRRPVRARRGPAHGRRDRRRQRRRDRRGHQLLARTEGIFGETAGGVVVATYRKLLAEGLVDPAAEVVLLNTGDGLKTLDAVAADLAAHLHDLAVLRRLRSPLRRGVRMSIAVKVPTILRTYTGGAADVAVSGATLVRGPRRPRRPVPGHRRSGARRLRAGCARFVNVYVNDDDVRFLEDLQTPTPDGSSISIIPAVAGG